MEKKLGRKKKNLGKLKGTPQVLKALAGEENGGGY